MHKATITIYRPNFSRLVDRGLGGIGWALTEDAIIGQISKMLELDCSWMIESIKYPATILEDIFGWFNRPYANSTEFEDWVETIPTKSSMSVGDIVHIEFLWFHKFVVCMGSSWMELKIVGNDDADIRGF